MPATPISWMASTSLPMASAVTWASSATKMSLVPAQTTAILPLPWNFGSRQVADCAGEWEILASRVGSQDGGGRFFGGSGDQNVRRAVQDFAGYGDYLVGGLS